MRTSLGITIALSLVIACKRQTDEQPAATVFEYDPELGRRFEAAVPGLELRDAAAPDAWAWTLPRCELEYAFRVTVDITAVGESKLPASGLAIFGKWTARADGSRMILRNGEVTIAHRQDGSRRPGMTEAAGKLAEIRLETDGRRWTEVDGPTSLWSAYGSWYGLTTFHPALPESAAVAAAVDWPITIFDRSAGVKVEAERGSLELPEGTELPEPQTETLDARVELLRWIELAGRRAAVLRSHFVDDGGGSFGGGMGLLGGMKAKRTGQGQFLVSADGVLIHAELRDRTEVRIRMGTETMEQLHVLAGEARLLRDCDGPVLPDFPEDRSATERAFDAVAALRNHAAAGERAELEALLDPEIVAAHPEAAGCLIGFVERFGPAALGMPELPAGDQMRATGSAVDLQLHARLAAADGKPEGSGEIEYALQVEGERVRVVAIRLRRHGDAGPWLWIEPYGELISAADCGDQPPPPDDWAFGDEPPTIVDEQR